MNSSSGAGRRRAVGVAGHTGDTTTARRGLGDPDGTVRIAAVRALARLDELTDDELARTLTDDDPAVRIAGLEIAASRPAPPIASLLHDPHPMVVESAAWAIGERADPAPAAMDALIDIARNHHEPLAREAAVAALGAIGDDRGLPALLDATTDKPAIRRRAVIALVAFEGPEVDEAWARARTDKDRQVRDAVEELLGPEDS
ncbi:MAG: HEAT repeat domain-containing protein [Acidimicrobiales bacterium]